MVDYSKFDKMIDVDGLKDDLRNAEENNTDFEDVPFGQYEVGIKKMELTESKKGDPMVSIWFEIISGDYKGRLLFYNQVISKGFGLHKADELLRSLDSGVEVRFENFKQYGDMLCDIAETIEKQKLEYALEYGEKKGYSTFEITEVFEA